MKPNGPCFEAAPNGYFSFDQMFTPQTKMKLLGVLSGFYDGLTVFDSNGKIWRVAELKSRHKTPLFRVLVRVFYNPWVDVEFVWRVPEDYRLTDLKATYLAAIDADDDILTQFAKRETLRKLVSEATSFDEVARIYQWAQREQR